MSTPFRSHTARYAAGLETISAANYGAYLRARSAVHHPDRSDSKAGAQIFWSAPQRRWLKVYSNRVPNANQLVVEYHATCPCAMT